MGASAAAAGASQKWPDEALKIKMTTRQGTCFAHNKIVIEKRRPSPRFGKMRAQ